MTALIFFWCFAFSLSVVNLVVQVMLYRRVRAFAREALAATEDARRTLEDARRTLEAARAFYTRSGINPGLVRS